MTQPQQNRLSNGLLLAYGLPALPLAILLLPLYVYLPAFYAQDLGLGFATVGLVFLVARVWDVVTDPLIGALSDKLPSRFGRRRPWILAGCPLVLLAAVMLFMPSAEITWIELLFWAALLYLGGTAVLLPYQAWGAELSGDYHERSRITGWREGLGVVGVLTAAALPAVLGRTPGESLSFIAYGFLLLLPPSLFVLFLLVPEPKLTAGPRRGWREGLRVIGSNAPFRRLLMAYFLNGIANGLPATLFLLYVGHVLQRPDWAGLFLVLYFASGIAAVPLWLMLSKRFGKHHTWMGAMMWAAGVFAFVPLLGAGDTAWFLVICLATGASLGADLVLPPAMQADVIDLDTLKSGRHRAGTFFAIWGVATKLALALAVGLAFPLLEWTGFNGENVNNRNTLWVLAALYSLLPALLKLGAVLLFLRYPLTAARQARIRRQIVARQGLALR